MKCHYCDQGYPLSHLIFIEDGMVPGIQMKRRRAQCVNCRNRPLAIDGKPSDPPPVEQKINPDTGEAYPF